MVLRAPRIPHGIFRRYRTYDAYILRKSLKLLFGHKKNPAERFCMHNSIKLKYHTLQQKTYKNGVFILVLKIRPNLNEQSSTLQSSNELVE
jgi:hypothetical protein